MRSFAQTIVETVREPLLVLDSDLTIQLASRSFHQVFQIDPGKTQGQNLFVLDGGAWDFPAMRALLGPALSRHDVVTGFKITHHFPWIGERSMLLHARKTPNGENGSAIIILGFEDITARRAIEQEKQRLQKQSDLLVLQKEILLREMQHRVLNSLQIIASILMLKARAVASEESRQHLQDAHQRVLSVAAVQQHLHSYGPDDPITIGPYLEKLCAFLAGSMIGESHPASLRVSADDGVVRSGDAVSLGLIVTELVINALKYAFPDPAKPAIITVRYTADSAHWTLSVSDNGVGRQDAGKCGLGTTLVQALARQLQAQVETSSSTAGMHTAITHAPPDAAAGI